MNVMQTFAQATRALDTASTFLRASAQATGDARTQITHASRGITELSDARLAIMQLNGGQLGPIPYKGVNFTGPHTAVVGQLLSAADDSARTISRHVSSTIDQVTSRRSLPTVPGRLDAAADATDHLQSTVRAARDLVYRP